MARIKALLLTIGLSLPGGSNFFDSLSVAQRRLRRGWWGGVTQHEAKPTKRSHCTLDPSLATCTRRPRKCSSYELCRGTILTVCEPCTFTVQGKRITGSQTGSSSEKPKKIDYSSKHSRLSCWICHFSAVMFPQTNVRLLPRCIRGVCSFMSGATPRSCTIIKWAT